MGKRRIVTSLPLGVRCGGTELRQFIRAVCAILLLVSVSACSLPRGAAIQSEITKEATAENPSFQVVQVTRENIPNIQSWPATGSSRPATWINHKAAPSSSVIRTGDRVNLTIWDSQPNSLITGLEQKSVDMKGIEVDPSGAIFVPYVDEVFVRGMTPATARARIQERLEPVVPSAQVQLTLQHGQDNSVDLVSGVAKPGTYPMPSRDYTILSLISAGGGISHTLRNPVVRLIRGGSTYEIRAEKLLASASKNTVLRGNDKVVVEEDKRFFTALGASGKESLIYFPKDRVTALEAVSLMGGLADTRADPKGVLVLREYHRKQVSSTGNGPEHAQVVFTMDLTSADGLFAARKFDINPGDTVLATESPITSVRTVFGLIGSMLGLSNQVNNL